MKTILSDISIIFFNGDNVGIAEAQNKGINFLLNKKHCDYIVFLDQDSRIGKDYIDKITDTYIKIKSFEPNLALLGPTAINARSQEEYKSVFHPKKTIDNIFIPQREIISSGTCVSVDVLKEVGSNLSWLFIDYVDFEWCWRANSVIGNLQNKRSKDQWIYNHKARSENFIWSKPFFSSTSWLVSLLYKYVPDSLVTYMYKRENRKDKRT